MIRNYHRTTNDIPRRDYHNDIDKVQEILATLENLLEEARALDKELKSNYREDYPEEQDNKNHRGALEGAIEPGPMRFEF
ncbi:hypothetical protein EYR36_001769 [Pleurotus pulmonarius]|nr:hypothetical protein EYR36_008290 [Pleurotus pulmonarius]KAF4579949.1 hypothetical protein EYR36_001769 [Pleurotus pulmonarius]